MSQNSALQRKEQFDEWYKWFNHKYKRFDKIRFRKPRKSKD